MGAWRACRLPAECAWDRSACPPTHGTWIRCEGCDADGMGGRVADRRRNMLCVCACRAHRPREAGFGIGSSMFGSICRMSCRPAFKNLEEHLGVPARMGPHHDRVGCTIGPLPNIRSRLSPIAPGLTEASTRGNAPRSGRHRTAVRPSYLRKAQWRGTEG